MGYHTLFETPLGICALAWNEKNNITAFQFPNENIEETEKAVIKNSASSKCLKAEEIPEEIKSTIYKIKKHLEGDLQNFSDVKLEIPGLSEFTESVYKSARKIPAGKTMTYGQLAKEAGHPGAFRATGRAMAENPIGLIIPCHRVLSSDGSLRGFSAYGGVRTKARLLELEGVKKLR